MNASIAVDRQPSSPGWKQILINVVIFQIAWFACVLGGAAGRPSVGIAVVAAAVACHLYTARRRLPEAGLLSLAALIGALWDGQLSGHGWLVYPSGLVAQWIAPTWIIAIWVSFATTLNVSLRWLHGRYGLAMILGALGGPLAFYAGERLAGVQFSDPLMALSVLSAGWALITPTLVFVAGHLDGYAPANSHTPDDNRIDSHAWSITTAPTKTYPGRTPVFGSLGRTAARHRWIWRPGKTEHRSARSYDNSNRPHR